jgi:hypothetical protein
MEHDSVNVKCPYYLGNNNRRQCQKYQIRCEGVSKGNNISLVFGSDLKRQSYKDTYCNSLYNCKNCLIHNMLDRKYGVNGEI